MKGLKGLIMAVGLMMIVGCGTLKINHIITGTECQTKEECIKDLGLDKQPEKPDLVFVVEPLLMNEKAKAPVGTPAFNSPVLYGDVELCAAKALRTEFRNVKVIFDDKDLKAPFIRVRLNKIVSQGVIPAKAYMRIDYEVTVNGKTDIQYAKTDAEVFWDNKGVIKKWYPEVCAILAKQVREFLKKENIIH